MAHRLAVIVSTNATKTIMSHASPHAVVIVVIEGLKKQGSRNSDMATIIDTQHHIHPH